MPMGLQINLWLVCSSSSTDCDLISDLIVRLLYSKEMLTNVSEQSLYKWTLDIGQRCYIKCIFCFHLCDM